MTRIDEASNILQALGLPESQTNERSSLTLLALANVKPDDEWKNSGQSLLRTVDLMAFMREHYDKDYAANTRETIRRQSLHQFLEARIVDLNPDDPLRPTNSGNTCYALTDAVLPVLRAYGTSQFEATVKTFLDNQDQLRDIYRRERELHKVPVAMPDGSAVMLSPGEHNILQKEIIEEFGPRFASGAVVLYLGDTAKKHLFVAKDELQRLAIPISEHDKLPDIVLYREDRHWLYLIEAVTSHGPVNPTRRKQLEKMLLNCDAEPIYVSAFRSREEFRKWIADIAWETEVWIAADPDHLIHFNGNKFPGPYPADGGD